ncbi:jg18120 [Pararge aegeria aegeria]|uniref:Jg18120 protein n=1 Tax=Pararge aegeria aegeria TaxID=348720 RepID=A0A8S4S825_9NEOP|nr:jg18120 [Pararge aegeria aegeria]
MLDLKHFVLLCALFLTVYCEDCPCRDDEITKDMKDFYDFLLNIPKDHDLDKYPIVAGELSPYVCNCIPKDRKKRKIVDVPEYTSRHHQPRKPARRRTSRGRIICAYGHRLIPVLNICVSD